MGVFTEALHPRGTGAQGGQFVSKGASKGTDTVGFDSKRGTGAGYGVQGGDQRVKQLQRILNNLGFKDANGQPLKVDGMLGPRTTAAIKRLQARMGMKQTGLVTPALLKHIQAVDTKRHNDFKAGKKNTLGNALSSLAPRHKAVARPAKKAAPVKKAPAKASKAVKPTYYGHG